MISLCATLVPLVEKHIVPEERSVFLLLSNRTAWSEPNHCSLLFINVALCCTYTMLSFNLFVPKMMLTNISPSHAALSCAAMKNCRYSWSARKWLTLGSEAAKTKAFIYLVKVKRSWRSPWRRSETFAWKVNACDFTHFSSEIRTVKDSYLTNLSDGLSLRLSDSCFTRLHWNFFWF